MKKILKTTKKCVLCQKKDLITFLKLGKIPKKNAEKNKTQKKKLPTLNICVCSRCWHVQAGSVPLPEFYVKNYTYHTRFSNTVKKHFWQRTLLINKKFNLKKMI